MNFIRSGLAINTATAKKRSFYQTLYFIFLVVNFCSCMKSLTNDTKINILALKLLAYICYNKYNGVKYFSRPL